MTTSAIAMIARSLLELDVSRRDGLGCVLLALYGSLIALCLTSAI